METWGVSLNMMKRYLLAKNSFKHAEYHYRIIAFVETTRKI